MRSRAQEFVYGLTILKTTVDYSSQYAQMLGYGKDEVQEDYDWMLYVMLTTKNYCAKTSDASTTYRTSTPLPIGCAVKTGLINGFLTGVCWWKNQKMNDQFVP